MTSHPFFLLIKPDGAFDTVIYLDEEGWKEKHKDVLAKPGRWFLCSTEASAKINAVAVVLAIQVNPGEVGFYAARHIGLLQDMDAEIVCYGIGKKTPDGDHIGSLWRMPNGMIVRDDEVFEFGVAIRDHAL